MTRIVDVHFPGLKKTLLTEALEVFFERFGEEHLLQSRGHRRCAS